jgi:hypothetical protein
MAWDIYIVGNSGYVTREKACQMAYEIWHWIIRHGIYGLTCEIYHGIHIMLGMMDMA